MQLPANDLALIRDTKAHYTDLYMSIFQPNVVLQAQVNGSITKGEMEIPFDNVSAGSWSNVKIGSTLLVGSNAGERNVGKVRIKSITDSVITVAENSHIEWANDLHLTVLDYFDVWPVYPRIIQNPSNPEATLWYKDYDIVYDDQNENLGCFMNIGPHRAVFVENGSAPLYFSASGSYPLSGEISDVQWTFQSGTPATYHGTTPGDVVWSTPGHYLVQCTISGSTGWIENGYRYVSVYDLPSEGTNVPIGKWELSNFGGSRGEAGYTATITVFEPITVEEGSIIVLFADEWYDTTRKSLGGNAPNASKIKFVGYVLDNSIEYDYANSSVSFEIGSISQIMKEMEGFAVGVNSVSSPNDWYELYDMNAKKGVYHYWKWHSNIIQLSDIEFIGEDFPVQYFDSDRENLWDAVDNWLRLTYHATAVCDRQGKIFLETDAYVRPDATGTYIPMFDMLKTDWIGTPNITERRYPELSYLEYGGIAYSGVVTGTYAPLLSEAPGNTPAYRGASDKRSGLALGGQEQLNQLVGNEFTHRNHPYPNIDFAMRGNWSNLDIAPQEVAYINIDASDTVRNKPISGLYMPSGINWDFRNKSFMPRVTWDVVTSGNPGESIIIPEIVDDSGYGSLGKSRFSIPAIIPPSLPIYGSTYSVLKLETNGGVALALSSSAITVPLTIVEFSSEGLPAGTASGTFIGANIVPVIGASGTYPFDYGFVSALPGIYRADFNLNITRLFPSTSSWTHVDASIGSNSIYLGQVANTFTQVYNLAAGGNVQHIHGSTVLKLPTNGQVWLTVSAATSGLILDRAFMSLEFMKYEI